MMTRPTCDAACALPDVRVQSHGTLFTFELLSDQAEEWWTTRMEGDVGRRLRVVEPRYARDIAQGLLDDGLSVE